MKFSLISDMHVDFPQPKTPYEKLERNVIVAGDTGNGLVGLKFLDKMRNKGHNVFAIDGNHEHYTNVSRGRSIFETRDSFQQSNPPIYEMDGVKIVGTNGWYQVQSPDVWFGYMNDGRNSVGANAYQAGSVISHQAAQDYFFLRDQLDMADDPVIVVTHTAPCQETLAPRFKGHYSNEWYWNPLMERLLEGYSEKILVWCHGHTHESNEQVVHGVRVVCNPRGYPGENPNWEPLTIEV